MSRHLEIIKLEEPNDVISKLEKLKKLQINDVGAFSRFFVNFDSWQDVTVVERTKLIDEFTEHMQDRVIREIEFNCKAESLNLMKIFTKVKVVSKCTLKVNAQTSTTPIKSIELKEITTEQKENLVKIYCKSHSCDFQVFKNAFLLPNFIGDVLSRTLMKRKMDFYVTSRLIYNNAAQNPVSLFTIEKGRSKSSVLQVYIAATDLLTDSFVSSYSKCCYVPKCQFTIDLRYSKKLRNLRGLKSCLSLAQCTIILNNFELSTFKTLFSSKNAFYGKIGLSIEFTSECIEMMLNFLIKFNHQVSFIKRDYRRYSSYSAVITADKYLLSRYFAYISRLGLGFREKFEILPVLNGLMQHCEVETRKFIQEDCLPNF